MPTGKKPEYSPGLAGVIAGETAICWVDPNAGLMYRGYDIHEMAQKASFEAVAYLMLNGAFPMENNRCRRGLISLKPAISFISSRAKFRRIGKSECWTRFSIFTPITSLTRPLLPRA